MSFTSGFRFLWFLVFGFLGFQVLGFSSFQVLQMGRDARFFGRDRMRSSTIIVFVHVLCVILHRLKSFPVGGGGGGGGWSTK